MIKNGNVTLERCKAKPSLILRKNDRITIDFSSLIESDALPIGENIPLKILYEDEELIVIDKEPGMVVHPGAGVHSGTLVHAILGHCGQTLPSLGKPSRAGIVHRLDRDTSGVMVVAKTQKSLTELSLQFALHKQHRLYNAICFGQPDWQSKTIDTGYGRHPLHRTRYSILQEGMGKRACTHAQVIDSFEDGAVSIIECRLETGRTHQIRVHLTHNGFPIVGDQVYGSVPQGFSKSFPQIWAYIKKNIVRQQLHAVTLGFEHPGNKKYIEFSSPYLPDMLALREFLKTRNHLSKT